MATAAEPTEPQAVPINVTAHIIAVLDATYAAHDALRPLFAVLPDAAEYPVIDLAVRLWASTRSDVRLVEWGHWTSEPSADRPGWWIEGYKLSVGFSDLITVHTPDGLRVRQPKVDIAPPAAPDNVIPLPVAPAAEKPAEPEARCSCGWSGPADRADEHDCRASLLELD